VFSPDVSSWQNGGEVCVSGRCKVRCEGVTCGIGTNRCACLPFHVGSPDLLCVPPALPPVC